jgi:hypothetical protein
MKERTLDYLNQLRPLTTNSRNQGQQIYKNYRNEGVSNYPHVKDYQKTMAQLQAEKENEQNIPNQYQQNKLNLDQSEAEKYKALQGQNEQFKTEYQSLQNQVAQKKAMEFLYPKNTAPTPSMASIWPQKKNVRPTVNVQPPVVAPRPTNVQQRPQVVNQSPQYPPGTQFAPTNWREQAPWSYPRGTLVMGSPGERVTYPGTPPPWYT